MDLLTFQDLTYKLYGNDFRVDTLSILYLNGIEIDATVLTWLN